MIFERELANVTIALRLLEHAKLGLIIPNKSFKYQHKTAINKRKSYGIKSENYTD